jgi:hypothetical protein
MKAEINQFGFLGQKTMFFGQKNFSSGRERIIL